ncbi:endonuclease NucS domain-containing protein [Zunongwangia sp. H14]|uniref:endonuclease NucS domain-containing protein n=1 Tax=Zunongwangia sp. H14 TaxID=3240792 RepID=UPI003566A113
MKEESFKNWLIQNGQDTRTIQSRISNCKTVERYEGNLDDHFIKDNGLSLLKKLSYSTEDERRNISAKHKIPINGNIRNGSATLKQATKLYMTFRNDYKSDPIDKQTIQNEDQDDLDLEYSVENNNFSYERDLKNSMVLQIHELFPDYKIYGENNEGIEYLIEGKRIDILLENNQGGLLVIELKSGVANYKVFGQISMYLGLLMEQFPDRDIKGCIVAGEIDSTLQNASKMTDRISLKTYIMKLELKDN